MLNIFSFRSRSFFGQEEESKRAEELVEPLLPNTTVASASPHRSRPLFARPRRRTLIVSIALLSILIPVVIYSFHFYYDPGYDDVFDFEPVIPKPKLIEQSVPPVSNSTPVNVDSLFDELSHRFQDSISRGPPKHQCPSPSDSPYNSRYAHLASRTGKLLIAVDLHYSAHILPSLSRSILEAIFFIGTDRVIVSIFENGSGDGTDRGMAHFAAILTHANVSHVISSDPASTNWRDGVDRIKQLAVFRNIVLEPLYSSPQVETVLFINDVYTCATDILELVHQRIIQDAHATCGLDYRWQCPKISWFGAPIGPKFYDNWVTRSLSGHTLRSRLDIFSEVRDSFDELFYAWDDARWRTMFREALPVPVYSCWNGIIAMDARPFLGITPEGGNSTRVVFRGGNRQQHECAASECKLVAKDFWNAGFGRWVLVPAVHVTYEEDLYNHPSFFKRLIGPAHARWSYNDSTEQEIPASTSSNELIDWNLVKKPKAVVCWPYRRRPIIEWPWTSWLETA